MEIIVTGSSGLLVTSLCEFLDKNGPYKDLKEEISDNEEDLEFITLDFTLKFLFALVFDFQKYLRKIHYEN